MFNKKQLITLLTALISIYIISIPLYAEVHPALPTDNALDYSRKGGVKVAVLDSGSSNPEVYFKAKSFTSIDVNNDPISHGTKICQIIKDNAPDAKIYLAQVCSNKEGAAKPDPKAIVQAIKWSEEQGVDIINLSLTLDYDAEVERAIKQAYLKKGIIFVVASGNKRLANQFAMRDGFVYLKEKDTVSFPASSQFVISVGALDRKGALADYSNSQADIFERGFGYGLEGTSIASAFATAKICKILPLNRPK